MKRSAIIICLRLHSKPAVVPTFKFHTILKERIVPLIVRTCNQMDSQMQNHQLLSELAVRCTLAEVLYINVLKRLIVFT